MKDFIGRYPDREFDLMFYADNEQLTVDKVQAFKCPPNDDDMRWVPEKGHSVSVGGRLFLTRKGAESKLLKDAVKERDRLKARLQKVEAILAG